MANQSYVDASPAVPFLVNLISASRKKEMIDAANKQDMAAAQADPGFWQKLAMGADAYKDMPAVQDYIYKQQAAPKLADLEGMLRGPEFQGQEGLQELRDRPEFWAGQTDYSNPYVAQAQTSIPRKAETQLQVGQGLQQMYDKGAISPELYAQIAVNDSLNVTGKDGKTNPLIDQMMKLGTHRNTEEGISNLQATYNDMGRAGFAPDAKLNALLATLRRGVDPNNPAKLVGIDAKPLHYGDFGTGAPGVTQPGAYDPNTNKVQNIGGRKVELPKNTNITVNAGDKKGIPDFISKLPDYHSGALTATRSNGLIGNMKTLIDKGTGGGAKNYALTTVAPALEMLGVDVKGMDEAQLYSSYAQMLGGQMRAEVIGPGPVTDYEQKLLKTVSGGGTMGAKAAKTLLTYYEGLNNQKIQTYKSYLSAAEPYAPETVSAYKTMDKPQNAVQGAAAAELERRRNK